MGEGGNEQVVFQTNVRVYSGVPIDFYTKFIGNSFQHAGINAAQHLYRQHCSPSSCILCYYTPSILSFKFIVRVD